jgi:hypothetical protein
MIGFTMSFYSKFHLMYMFYCSLLFIIIVYVLYYTYIMTSSISDRLHDLVWINGMQNK